MNASELKRYCLEHAGEELPAEAHALLEQDPALRREVERLVAVRNLISLKRHEQPAPECLARCVDSVNRRIASGEGTGLLARLRDAFTFESAVPAYAYAAAALAVCAVGAALLLRGPVPGAELAVDDRPAILPEAAPEPAVFLAKTEPLVVEPLPVVAEAVEAEPVLPFDKPIIVLRTAPTNPEPRATGLTIGGGEVMPVSFGF